MCALPESDDRFEATGVLGLAGDIPLSPCTAIVPFSGGLTSSSCMPKPL